MLVVPAIDLVGGQCVRLFRGDFKKQMTYQTDPVDQARAFQAVGFERLHVVDLEGARFGDGRNRDTIRKVISAVDIPVQIGGGIRRESDVEELLGDGASHLILGTSVLSEPDQVERWIEKWGAAPFIISLDLRGQSLQSEGWLKSSGVGMEDVLARIAAWQVVQVICTDVEQDGTLLQPNYATYVGLLSQISEAAILIAAGGVSHPQHISRLREIGVGGAVVGRALYEGQVPWESFLHAG